MCKMTTNITKSFVTEIKGNDDSILMVYDAEFKSVEIGEAHHTKLAYIENWGHVYVDVDENEQPLAVTVIVKGKK